MFVSDDWLVQLPGYKKAIEFTGRYVGRAIYSSDRGGFMLCVIDNVVFKVTGPNNNLSTQALFELETFTGDVFIDENLASQIGICDQKDLWIYNFQTGVIEKVVFPNSQRTNKPIHPTYITYHDGYFIVPNKDTPDWYLSKSNNGLDWNWGAGPLPVSATIQTKPDNCVAVLRAPGKGNLIYVFGKNVVELWYDNGGQIFPYQRSTSDSVDYGCLSSTTIAAMDNFIAWLGVNEKSGPVIMVSTGSGFQRLSTDGIDFKLADVQFPEDSYGFFYKSDGHVLYQLTFFNPVDNFTLVYDFNTKLFFYATDENMNFHIAESVAYFNDTYYFVDIGSGSVFELNSSYTSYDYTLPSPSVVNPNPPIVNEIPRMRVCNTMRQTDASPFIANSLAFTIDQGNDTYFPGSIIYNLSTEDGRILTTEAPYGYVGHQLTTEQDVDPYVPRIDMSISKDGGNTFGSFTSVDMYSVGNRLNRVTFWKLGRVNDLVVQFRFWSKSSVTVSNGVLQARTAGASR